MFPLFRKGDIIFIEPIDIEQISIGDIIVCQRRDRMAAHRLMKKYIDNRKIVLVTKGDTFSEFDEPLDSEDMLGKVTVIERKGRRLRINNGLYGVINTFCAKLSPYSKWIYPPLRKIKHGVYKIKVDMRPEDLLMRCCAQANIDRNQHNKIKNIIRSGLNWTYFFDKVQREGVAGLIYKSLSQVDNAKSLVPEGLWERLESSYYAIAVRNLRLYQKLVEISSFLKEKEIEFIILKGMALLNDLYSDIGLRPMYDIDILIHKQDFSLVEQTLKKLGYQNSSFYPEDFHKDDMMVDMHWDLTSLVRVRSRQRVHHIDLKELWRDSRIIEIEREGVRILSLEDMLIGLSLHFSLHHGFNGLIWAVDIAELLKKYKKDLDWKKLTEKCYRFKVRKPVYYTLWYVKEILQAQVPSQVIKEIRPQRQNFLEKAIFNLMLKGHTFENVRFLFTLFSMEGFLNRLLFLKEVSFPAPKILKGMYHISSPKLIPKYYLIHIKIIIYSALNMVSKFSLGLFRNALGRIASQKIYLK